MTKIDAGTRQMTAADVLLKIQQIMRKHEIKRPINLDSVALSLHIQPSEIVPYIDELEQQGHVKKIMPATNSFRATNIGSVMLL